MEINSQITLMNTIMYISYQYEPPVEKTDRSQPFAPHPFVPGRSWPRHLQGRSSWSLAVIDAFSYASVWDSHPPLHHLHHTEDGNRTDFFPPHHQAGDKVIRSHSINWNDSLDQCLTSNLLTRRVGCIVPFTDHIQFWDFLHDFHKSFNLRIVAEEEVVINPQKVFGGDLWYSQIPTSKPALKNNVTAYAHRNFNTGYFTVTFDKIYNDLKNHYQSHQNNHMEHIYLCRWHDVVIYIFASHSFRVQAVVCNNDPDFWVKQSDAFDEDIQLIVPQERLGCYSYLWVNIWVKR